MNHTIDKHNWSADYAIFIAHITSQLTGKWIDVTNRGGVEASLLPESSAPPANLSDLSAIDWRIQIMVMAAESTFPWLASLLTRKPEMADRIAFYCHSEVAIVKARGANIVLYNSPNYPRLLREISDPPAALTVIGSPEHLGQVPIAVVGARKASGFAVCESYALGRILADSGFMVVSGGAFGCDIACHQGVLASEKLPVPAAVVLAGGLSSTYPRANDFVFRKIIDRGGILISERLWWAPPKPRDFAARNRIVSGICPQVIVMQAGDRSGALITARSALEQGRDVWVLKHDEDDIRAAGGHRLIADGALIFDRAEAFMEMSGLGRN